METTVNLKDGDIYRWSYRESGNDAEWGRYHCCSRIAIVSGGRLHDTYWMVGMRPMSDGRSFGPGSLHTLNLVFVANLADLEKSREYNSEYYDDADIVNLNHANSSTGNFYLRKGAVRSAEKMLATARDKFEQAQAEARAAVRRAGELKDAIAKIEAGDTTVYL